jgi:hypothetical protein
MIVDHFAAAGQQQRVQALSREQQGLNPDAEWETVPEQPALLPADMPPPPQASTGLLVLEAVQQAAAAAAGLTEGLAGTFAAVLPLPAEQVRLVGWQGWIMLVTCCVARQHMIVPCATGCLTTILLSPLPGLQDECLRLMLQRRQYSGAAGLMRAVLHMRGIPPLG